jgi:hypothetical protein
MSVRTTRRTLLRQAATGGTLLGLGGLSFLSRLPAVSAGEATLPAGTVRLRPEIEPVVRLLEGTPRERLLEEVAARIRRGLSYREVLAALLLAGVRNVQPRPSVGFKFHAVLVVNSVHLAAVSGPDADRWLPIFWSLDYFKDSQARDVGEGNWTMPPVDESAVPPAQKAKQALIEAMDRWDEAAADAAVAALARTAGSDEVFELFYRYGARDFRSIGHKAIFVAQSRRTLAAIGWEHAEPVLRSLAYALLMHEGDNPAQRDAEADRPGRRNQELAGRIRPDWRDGKVDAAATAEMLAALRQGSPEEVCDKAVELLGRGIAPQSLWDALLTGAEELLLRQPGIVALHAATTTNALHFAYLSSAGDLTRRYLLLQNAAFLVLFREAMGGRGRLRELRIDTLEPLASKASGPELIEEIFADVSRDRLAASRKALGHLQAGADPRDLIAAARRLIFLKGNDPHDYKFSSAALEDCYHTSPAWRDRYLAASLMLLPGSGDRDNELVRRTRAALQG